MKIVFLGTPAIAVPALRLLAKNHEVVGVITAEPSPVGRKQILTKSPVHQEAEALGLNVITPPKAKTEHLAELQPDLVVVIAYGQILSDKFLYFAPLGAVNVHYSLLPQYRGASPVQSALLAGDKITGITIQQMVYALDAGDILSQYRYEIKDTDTTESLFAHFAEAGAELLLETLERPFSPEQQVGEPTFCTKFSKADGELDFTLSAQKLNNRRRAFTPWPGVFTFWNGKRVKILDTFSSDISAEVGQVFSQDGHLYIGSGEGSLGILSLQMEGKKPQDAKSFLNSFPDFLTAKL